jgi:hypothetical protein
MAGSQPAEICCGAVDWGADVKNADNKVKREMAQELGGNGVGVKLTVLDPTSLEGGGFTPCSRCLRAGKYLRNEREKW